MNIFFRLPQDLYQTAKIAKLLLVIDKGEAHKYKGIKELQDIKVEETDCLEIEKEEIQEGINSFFLTKSTILVHEFQFLESMETLRKTTTYISRPHEKEQIQSDDENHLDINSFNKNKKIKLTNNCNEKQNRVEEGIDKTEIKSISLRIGSKTKKLYLYFSGKALRGKWNAVEKEVMSNYFKNFITNKKAPKKKDVQEFKIKEKDLFENTSWLRIKTFVYNQYKNKV